MAFLEIFLRVFKNLIGLLMTWFFNTPSHDDGGDEEQTTRASSSSTPPKQNYEVFLSFRGEDTRLGFTDHLYHGLKDRGIEVFRDSEELHVGEKIDQLFEAIKASKISVPIISRNYASSIWCLKELVQILECKKMLGQLVLPIFYHVKPSDVRKLKGDFGETFRQCKRKHNLGGKFVQELENAFEEVANIKVWEVNETENRYEGELVAKVVTKIFSELRKAVLRVPNFLVGVEDHVKEIKKRIDAKPSHDAKIIGIHGMGGIGKTTLAKVLYNVLCNDFECCSFVANIREESKKKGMEALQEQLVSNILYHKLPQKISHDDEGITIIENNFKGKRVLLLLDDVENKDQLNKLVAKKGWLGSQSIVIITTRNKDVTVASAVNLSYELNELNDDQSYELFCKHAFKEDASCPRDLETLARKITSTTGGLPLAVEVIGSFLHQKDEDFWKEALDKLRRVPNEEVRDKLKISYDHLEYGQKQIFLDIACLSFNFVYAVESASYMWKSCGFYPKEGIERLISLSLIKRDDTFSKITIHDQLRDLGRQIVQEEGRYNVGLCSRIWLKDQALEVMEEKKGTDKLQALMIPVSRVDERRHYTSEDFEGMPNLRFLVMYSAHLTGDFEKLFLNLRWLQWINQCHPCVDIMGINLNPKKLVFLDIFNSNVTEHWKGWSCMEHLKVIILVGCPKLTTTPDFTALKELEVLHLFSCEGLKKIHPSIGMLSKLRELSLRGCTKLKSLPNLPSNLTTLSFDGDSMETLPDLSNLINLKSLTYKDLFERRNKALNLGYLNQLEDLRIEQQDFNDLRRKSKISDPAEELDMTPENFSLQLELPVSLLRLKVYGCQTLHTLPNFSKFKNLSKLRLMDCSELMEINGLGGAESLKVLKIERCRMLSRLGDLSHLKVLGRIQLSDCDKLSDVQGIEKSPALTSLIFIRCYLKIKFLDLSMLTNLKVLMIEDKELMEIQGLQELESLEDLHISGCKSLQYLSDLSQCTQLIKLVINGCEQLREILGLQELKSLEHLDILESKSLQHLPDLSQCTKLIDLSIMDCEKLREIPGLQELESLDELFISGCKSLQYLPDLLQCTKLTSLHIVDCEKLREILGFQELKSLELLGISACESLQHLPNLSQCTKLTTLIIKGCQKLIEIPGLQELKSLQYLEILGCELLQHLPDFSQYTKLRKLIVGCEKLIEIRGLENLRSLEELDIRGCSALSNLPSLPNVKIKSGPLREEEGNSDFSSLESEEEKESDPNPVEENE